jgi:4-hydroxybenzoate polyprenyltransferase
VPPSPPTDSANNLTTGRWRDWLRLCRPHQALPAMAEPLAGALLVGAGWQNCGAVLALMLTSACLYAAGAALNDLRDFKRDLVDHPDRPLPAGRIGRVQALVLALLLFATGTALAAFAGESTFRLAVLLVIAIILYDLPFKAMPLAPALLAACRVLNLLLGMMIVPPPDSPVDWSLRAYLLCGIGMYTLGLAVFARKEPLISPRRQMLGGSIATWAAILAIVMLRLLFPRQASHPAGLIWACLLMLAVGYRMIQALLTPEPARTRQAIDATLTGLVVLDTAMVGFIAGLWPSLPVAAFLIPAAGLGRSPRPATTPQTP